MSYTVSLHKLLISCSLLPSLTYLWQDFKNLIKSLSCYKFLSKTDKFHIYLLDTFCKSFDYFISMTMLFSFLLYFTLVFFMQLGSFRLFTNFSLFLIYQLYPNWHNSHYHFPGDVFCQTVKEFFNSILRR